MLPLVAVFVFWLALHGKLKTYADFATVTNTAGSAPGSQTPTSRGPIQNTQPGVSTGQGVINNVLAGIRSIFTGGSIWAPGSAPPGR